MKHLVLSFIVFFAILEAGGGSAWCLTLKATTEDGKKVILNTNGTWAYEETASQPTSSSSFSYIRPLTAAKALKGRREKYSVWYDDAKWKPSPVSSNQYPSESTPEFQFNHASGDAVALVIYERFLIPGETARDAAMDTLRKAAPDIRIVQEENRIVNGKQVLCLRTEGTIGQIPTDFFCYYYAGKSGFIQFVTYAKQELFEKNKKEMQEILNGLDVIE